MKVHCEWLQFRREHGCVSSCEVMRMTRMVCSEDGNVTVCGRPTTVGIRRDSVTSVTRYPVNLGFYRRACFGPSVSVHEICNRYISNDESVPI